jgi:hypothetical protein
MKKAYKIIHDYQTAILLFLIVVLSLVFEYNHILHMAPQSMHDWRQADCASFAMMYFDHGMNFFEPKVFNLLMGGGHAAGEFPILYYFVAILYKIFGPHELIYRLVFSLIFFVGLLNLGKVVKRLLDSLFCFFLIPLLVFSSPLLMFFGNNFLCDASALSFVFVGLNFILKYRDTQKILPFWLSMLFFLLAALLKLNSAICFVAIAGLFFFEFAGWATFGKQAQKMFVHLRSNIIGFALVLILLVAWYKFAIYYNELHFTSFLGTKSWPGWPIWEASNENFLKTVNAYVAYSDQIFSFATSFLLPLLLLFILLNRKYLDSMIFGILLLSTIGVALFVCIFFVGIYENIYYCVNLMILPVLIFISSLMIVKAKFSQVFHSPYFKMILAIVLASNIYHSKDMLKTYYHNGKEHYKSNLNFYKPEFRRFIDSIGIKKTDLVISYPDKTPDVTLNLIGRQGWSEYNGSMDTTTINNWIAAGADYLILSDITLLSNPAIRKQADNFVANFDNIFVYKLASGPKAELKEPKDFIVRTKDKFVSQLQGEKKYLFSNSDSLAALRFSLIHLYNDNVAIKTQENTYWSIDLSLGAEATSFTPWIANWETFQLVKKEANKFALKGYNGKYLSVVSSANNQLICISDSIGKSELFEFIE